MIKEEHEVMKHLLARGICPPAGLLRDALLVVLERGGEDDVTAQGLLKIQFKSAHAVLFPDDVDG